MDNHDDAIAAFLAKGGKVTKVATGFSQIATDKAERAQRAYTRRTERDYENMVRDDRWTYARYGEC